MHVGEQLGNRRQGIEDKGTEQTDKGNKRVKL